MPTDWQISPIRDRVCKGQGNQGQGCSAGGSFSTMIFHYDFFCWGFVPSSVRLAINYRVNLKTVRYRWTQSCCGAEESAGRPGSARSWQGHECFHSWGFLSKAGCCRKTTFSVVFHLVSSATLILSTLVCHKTSSTNSKMNVKPWVEGTCLPLCYFTL